MEKNIIIAENCQTALIFELLLFSDKAVHCQIARTGIELLQLVSNQTPSLILANAELPETDGIECCRLLKLNNEWRQIPFIIITPRQRDDLLQQALDAKCDCYLTKPLNKVTFTEAIKKLGVELD